MMAERLAVSEGKLMKLHHDEVIKNLVAAKMELAQSQFETLEIQVAASTHVSVMTPLMLATVVKSNANMNNNNGSSNDNCNKHNNQ